MKKIKVICLYQVVMHYRLPFYERINKDNEIDFTLIHGRGKKGSKLINTNLDKTDFRRINLRDYRIPLPFSPSLFFTLFKENPDIVFTEGSSSLINSSIAFIYAKLFRKKIIWWSLGTLKNKPKNILRKIIGLWEKIIEKKSDAIFTYSTQGLHYFQNRGVLRSKIFVSVNVFDTSLKLKEINSTFISDYLSKEKFNIGFIGTLQKSKNLELLIDVVDKLNMKYKKDLINLHIIGDGEHYDFLKNYSRDCQGIIFYGRLNTGSSKILKNCDLMVLPGLGGLAIVEGMLNSLPIITGYADGTELDLVDKENGVIIENMNFHNLFTQIEYFYNNQALLINMGLKSFKKITENYSFENYYSNFKRMIHFVNN